MRVIFNEELKAVADDLDHMVKGVRKAINGAGDALLNQNLEAAQAVIDGDIEIDALEASVVDQCVKLLAKQNPVATDLRVVVSTMRLATTSNVWAICPSHRRSRPPHLPGFPRCRPKPNRCSPKCSVPERRRRPDRGHAV